MKVFFSSVIMTMLCASLLLSCKKGDVGPAGATGAAGPAGPAGPAGAVGSANVTQYNFAAFAHSGVEVSKTFNLSKVDFEKSLLYVYVTPSNGFWYPLPGTTAGATKDYRIYFGNATATTTIYINRVAGTGSENLTMRIVAIPAATQVNGRMNNSVDMSDYLAVAKYYNLPVR